MNVLFASSELSPYAKTGGLGEVMSALPAMLRKRGHSVSVVLPLYRAAAEAIPDRRLSELNLSVPMGETRVSAHIWETVTDQGVKLFLIQKDEYFDRSHLYGNAFGDYTDAAERFMFYSKMVIELARYIDPVPDILHLHDWQVGMIPALVRGTELPFRTVFTLHNLAYQGSFPDSDFKLSNLDPKFFTPQGIEFYGRLNYMKAGIALANQITTVSPRYATEIQTPALGCGLEGVLQENSYKLTGILNGIDADLWNPAKDTHLKTPFTAKDLKGKASCKSLLAKKFKFKNPDLPLFVSISRLVGQKGFDLLVPVLEDWISGNVNVIIHGSGDRHYETALERLQRKNPGNVAVQIGYNDALAHQLIAGGDFLLAPSRFEPCGLNALYALRYGTLPVVHATGGLDDAVRDDPSANDLGTGIKFSQYSPDSLREALNRAIALYQSPASLKRRRQEAMRSDLSWESRAANYEEVYMKALK